MEKKETEKKKAEVPEKFAVGKKLSQMGYPENVDFKKGLGCGS